jgi:hypothetical protein
MAMFCINVFLKYFKNTAVSQNSIVYNTLRRLPMDENYGINTEVSLKL